MGMRSLSDIVESRGEVLGDLLALHHLGIEAGALLGVLQDARDLDGAGPVDVVEALGEDELLEVAFLEFAGAEDDSVVTRNRHLLLRVDEKVIPTNYLSAYKRS